MWIKRLIKKIFKNNQRNAPSPLIPLPQGARKMGERGKEVEKRTELERITQNQETITKRLEKLEADLGKAIGGYRQALISQNPDILPELIGGSSIEDLDRSLVTAQDLTEKIKKKLEAKTAAEKVPGGAPARSPPDTANLSSHEKIVYGLEKR